VDNATFNFIEDFAAAVKSSCLVLTGCLRAIFKPLRNDYRI